MPPSPDAGREHWTGVLAPGGFTALPRWSTRAADGDGTGGVATGRLEVAVPEEHSAALLGLAGALGLPLSAVLLAAHAKVLAALAGEREVVTGYVPAPGARALPCRVPTGAATWRELVRAAGRAEAGLLDHADVPVAALADELGLSTALTEAVLDPAHEPGDLPEGTVLAVGTTQRCTVSGIHSCLVLRYRTGVLDDDAAARIAGYHLTALALIAADPDAEHARQSLLSAEERRHQIHGLAGPHRELPDLRVHEIFEERARAHPEAVAAVLGDEQLTYGELDARANRLGRALLARGVQRESVVAVVMERDLDWMAAVLAVWKAGGVYLPLEPHFPPSRIAAALARSGCRLVLGERGSTATLDQALEGLPGIERLLVDDAWAEGHADGALGIPVAADQLAYVLFTSGSTGEPKGALCEHAGMLNHIQAKLTDLRVGEGGVVPQTGPQCFDISVWQLVGALLVGGRTLLVPQEVVLDVERFVDTLVEGRATTVQVVPSYLDVVVTYLEQHPRALPDLRSVCPTGDFLKKSLVERWFAVQPGIPVVNTYGLTETSDDAVHETMTRPPDRDQVPLGRPIQNTTVYVVDEHLSPVPLGAPGLIVFSGVCVGRGYVNDPERTAAVFGADPLRPGERICRTGDYGRWLPDGKLDFLGRRDHQVKIRGFRIEIGDIENGLLRVPGVRDGAVVVAEGPDRTPQLLAFYSGEGPLEPDVLRRGLAEAVPDYMVPSAFHWRERLPLTANGKIDRTALTALAGELAAPAADRDAPRTPAEQRVAAAWAGVLGVPEDQVGRDDHFFDSGGTSLSAVKLVIALGRAVSLKEITARPVLADLAELLDSRSGADQPVPRPRGAGPGAPAPVTTR